MTPDNWKRLETLYYAALERPAELRASFLEESCEGDDELRANLESLLRADAVNDDFLSRPALQIAAVRFSEEYGHRLPGRNVAQYQILSMLGAGGMGAVYLAHDTRLNRKVAIKFLYPESTADASARTLLLNEAQAAAALDHPNICTVYEAAEVEVLSLIVMQYVEGET